MHWQVKRQAREKGATVNPIPLFSESLHYLSLTPRLAHIKTIRT
ncbi:hypothetical protein VCR31J2_1360099 [Vibrio coralliirubri]|uniref:Uncharacterized protein n=1 Tax=Vibrio coralliirubri TaxID=1516159 RepID=A0AA86X2M9_9VIBR|nr:hypothetical protein VCR31J2_1360099 [Vibrio coralliirubri]